MIVDDIVNYLETKPHFASIKVDIFNEESSESGLGICVRQTGALELVNMYFSGDKRCRLKFMLLAKNTRNDYSIEYLTSCIGYFKTGVTFGMSDNNTLLESSVSSYPSISYTEEDGSVIYGMELYIDYINYV